jgi:hypothetical protein
VDGRAAAGESFALLRGLRDTRATFDRWRRDPGSVLAPWFAGSFAIAVAMLLAVWAVSGLVPVDITGYWLPGIDVSPDFGDFAHIYLRNLLVLALHAFACVAGFMAGSSMPLVAETKTGLSRLVHERAGPVAIGWVVLVTAFSLLTQVYYLSQLAAQIANQYDIGTGVLVLTVAPHALLELTAVFLPLAAWLIASRRDEWEELLAATFVTVAIALPILIVAALMELTLWPALLRAVSPVL